MSIDFALICASCKKYAHLGQRFAGGQCCFGFGSNDEKGRVVAANFMVDHCDCGELIVSYKDTDLDGLEWVNGSECTWCGGSGLGDSGRCPRCQGTGVE